MQMLMAAWGAQALAAIARLGVPDLLAPHRPPTARTLVDVGGSPAFRADGERAPAPR